MKLDDVIQQPGQMERIQQNSVLGRMNVARVGTVVKYDSETKCVDVQLDVRDLHSKSDPPILTGVPVIFLGSYVCNVFPGDECVVIFADSSIDGWWQTGKISNPVTGRRHDLSDGFALVGVHSLQNAWKGINLDEILPKKADIVSITSAENWGDVWGEISAMIPGTTLTLYADASAVSIIAGETRSTSWGGTITRESETDFTFIARYGPNNVLIAKLTDASSSGATYAQSDVSAILGGKLDKANVYNGLDKAAEGFALDARQGKVLNDNIEKLDAEKARVIVFTDEDNTWQKMWAKINALENGETAAFYCYSDVASVFTSGVNSNTMAGTISRYSGSTFGGTIRLGSSGNGVGVFWLSNASASSAGSFSLRNVGSELSGKVNTSAVVNNHTTTEAGYVLDARQGKTIYDRIDTRVVGQRLYIPVTGKETQQSVRIDVEGGAYFVILQLPGVNRTWVGIIYVNGSGTVTFAQINTAQTGITVTTSGTYRFYANFTYTSDTNIHMVAIPLRNNTVPVFHE